MSEQKKQNEGRNIFYFQFKENFFDSSEISNVEELAKEEGDNPNDYVVLYQKMICKSLATEGYLSYGGQKLSPSIIKRILRFETASSFKETVEIVDRAIKKFIDAQLILLISDGTKIYIPQVKLLVMSKKENSEYVRLWRQEKAALDKEVARREAYEKDTDDLLEIELNKVFSGLFYLGYFNMSQKDFVSKEIYKYCEENNLFPDELKAAFDLFFETIKEKDIREIGDKLSYLKTGIKNNIEILRMKKYEELDKQSQEEKLRIASFDWVNNKA